MLCSTAKMIMNCIFSYSYYLERIVCHAKIYKGFVVSKNTFCEKSVIALYLINSGSYFHKCYVDHYLIV